MAIGLGRYKQYGAKVEEGKRLAKKYAEEQTAIVNKAWDDLREAKGWRKSGAHAKSE